MRHVCGPAISIRSRYLISFLMIILEKFSSEYVAIVDTNIASEVLNTPTNLLVGIRNQSSSATSTCSITDIIPCLFCEKNLSSTARKIKILTKKGKESQVGNNEKGFTYSGHIRIGTTNWPINAPLYGTIVSGNSSKG